MSKAPESGIINTRQSVWLLFVIITSLTALQVPGLIVLRAGRDVWLSVIGAWFMDIMLALVYAYMGIRFPGENPVQYSMTILGKTFGRIVGLLFIIFFLMVACSLVSGVAMYVAGVFLPKTPTEVVLISAFLLIAYIVRKGIEVIARICEILGPFHLLSMVALLFLALPLVNLGRLKPQFDQGVVPFLSGVPLILAHIGICVSMGWYIAICNRPENGFLAKFIAAGLGSSVLCLLAVFSIGSFGLEQTGNMINPGLQLARIIHIDYYFERMEVFWMAIAIGAGIMTAVNVLWIFSLGAAQLAGLSTYKPLVYPAALIALALSLTSFPTNTSYMHFAFYTFPLVGLSAEIGLELLLFFAALISGKRGKPAV